MNSRTFLLIASVAALTLAGCLGNTVTIERNGAGQIDTSKSLNCAGSGTLTIDFGGGSDIVVTVRDGDNNLIYGEGGASTGKVSGSSLNGLPGKWTVAVKGNYVGDLLVKLRC